MMEKKEKSGRYGGRVDEEESGRREREDGCSRLLARRAHLFLSSFSR